MENSASLAPLILRVNVLGVGVSAVTIPLLLEQVALTIDHQARARFVDVNPYGLNLAYEQPWLRAFYNASEYIICDGFGVKWGARLVGGQLPARITEPDWMPLVMALSAERGYRVYLLGNAPGVTAQAAHKLQAQFPGLNVVGAHSGYFDRTPGSAENEAALTAINAAHPHILYVGLGMPRQERWLLENWDRLTVNVAITCGALFDYVAGVTRRGPSWMTEHGLEWVSRLAVEPNRLWRRYLIGNPLFVWRLVKQRFGILPPG
jgi:N-acetylglucosaminyldiphosphoundecaprenol N-acetyl-beta-D-mannosaminyltransferase